MMLWGRWTSVSSTTVRCALSKRNMKKLRIIYNKMVKYSLLLLILLFMLLLCSLTKLKVKYLVSIMLGKEKENFTFGEEIRWINQFSVIERMK